jgi:hypothetical protein
VAGATPRFSGAWPVAVVNFQAAGGRNRWSALIYVGFLTSAHQTYRIVVDVKPMGSLCDLPAQAQQTTRMASRCSTSCLPNIFPKRWSWSVSICVDQHKRMRGCAAGEDCASPRRPLWAHIRENQRLVVFRCRSF